MKYSQANPPLVCMMTNSTCYRETGKMEVKGVLWHSTGANNPSLKRYVQPSDGDPNYEALIKVLGKNKNGNDWNHIARQAGLNCWVGKLADGTVSTVQTMPWNFRPWGCGSGSKGSCNHGWIQFEICEDGLTDAAYFNQAYQEACEITAYLCKLYNIDPHGSARLNGVTVPTILCHWDSSELGLGSAHIDIYHWFTEFGKDMETVRNDVAALLSGETGKNKEEVDMTKDEVKELVKETVNEAVSQAVSQTVLPAVTEALGEARPVYTSVEEVPRWYRDAIQKLVEQNVILGVDLKGTLRVSEDFCQVMTVLDRLKLLD